jgi:hypothetical protein
MKELKLAESFKQNFKYHFIASGIFFPRAWLPTLRAMVPESGIGALAWIRLCIKEIVYKWFKNP